MVCIKYGAIVGKYVIPLPFLQYAPAVYSQDLPHQPASTLFPVAEKQEVIKVFYYFISSLAPLHWQ